MVNIPEENRTKVDKIYKYLKEIGPALKDPYLSKKSQVDPSTEKRLQQDFLHKVLLIWRPLMFVFACTDDI